MSKEFEERIGNDNAKAYGDRNTKCKKCKYSIFDKLKVDKWRANVHCEKYKDKGKPMSTFKEDKDFFCDYFEEKNC